MYETREDLQLLKLLRLLNGENDAWGRKINDSFRHPILQSVPVDAFVLGEQLRSFLTPTVKECGQCDVSAAHDELSEMLETMLCVRVRYDRFWDVR